MKKFKILFCFFLLGYTSTFAQTYNLDLSYGLANSATLAGNSLESGAYQLNLVYMARSYDTLSVGAGASYVWPSAYAETADEYNPVDFIIPVYGVIKYEIMPEATIEPYIIGKAGFGFAVPNSNIEGNEISNGLYYSVGAGAVVNDFFAEFTYDINQGNYSTTNDGSGQIEYTRFTISIGYKLRFTNPEEDTYYNKQVEYVNPKRERTFDNVEVYDENGELIERDGEINNLTDYKIID